MSVAPKLKTNAELCRELDALADDQTGEVIDGTLYVMGRPSLFHQTALLGIGSTLKFGSGGGPPISGWVIGQEVEVRFPSDETVVPDLSGWKSERIAGQVANPMRVVPDWVCEILSDSTRKKDIGPKRRLYAQQKVAHLWLVDPVEHSLEVFERLPDETWRLLGTWEDDAVLERGVAPFLGTRIDLNQWWLSPP